MGHESNHSDVFVDKTVGVSATAPFLENLVSAIAAGSSAALEQLYDQTSGLVNALAMRVVGNREDAEEIVLDVYTRVWKNAARFDSTRGNAVAWLILMTRSQAIDRLRQRASRLRRAESMDDHAEIASAELSPEQKALWHGERRVIKAALDSLPAEQRQALNLAFYEGLTHAELAERLQLPLGTVKTRIQLGLKRMRKFLSAPKQKEFQA
jgi:RNA polymerase sigma-70 factor (ECF subfamily)